MIPPKRLTVFSPDWGMLRRSDFFFKPSNYQEYTEHDDLQSMPSLARHLRRTSALLLVQSTEPMTSLLSGRWSSSALLVHLQIPGRPPFGSCSGGRAVLALVRPMVPYTLALSAALSADGVSGSSTLKQHSPGQPAASPAPLLQGGFSSFWKLCSPSQF